MSQDNFLSNIAPGNYFITKSMELTKSESSGTLWYTKKFIVLYYYIFLNDNICTSAKAREICCIFNNYINSLPETLQEKATEYFYAAKDVADLRDEKFKLFDAFAGQKQFKEERERIDYYECAKKYYFAFLMGSGGQSGVNDHIKGKLYEEDFAYSDIEDIIIDYTKKNECNPKTIASIRNDYMAFIRNERQILFYYGFFHSKSSGSKDREFSSLTPVGELALHSNYYEMIALWEHQKIKMVSQPVSIEIKGLDKSMASYADSFSVNKNPYLTILMSLQSTKGFSKETYQYIISRLPEYPSDGIDTSDTFLQCIKEKVGSFQREADVKTEDFNKELLKYILGIRSDLKIDMGKSPLGLCKWNRDGITITNATKLDKLIKIYTTLCLYKKQKYSEVLDNGISELKRQYTSKVKGEPYTLDSKIKIDWDMYNIQIDMFILLATSALTIEEKKSISLSKTTIDTFVDHMQETCPNILKRLGLSDKLALKKELRDLIGVFTKKTFETYFQDRSNEYSTSIETYLNLSLSDLQQKIEESSNLAPEYRNGVRKRNMTLIGLIKSYNRQKHSSKGTALKCECCGDTTFITYKGESYLEYHHLIPFSEYDGPDHHLNILALCPLCHRKFHFLKTEEKRALYDKIAVHSYNKLSIEERLKELYNKHRLRSYQLEYLLADNAIDDVETYNPYQK